MKCLICDTTNTIFRNMKAIEKSVYNDRNSEEGDIVSLAIHSLMITLNKVYKKFKPDQIVFAFEGGNNWRKQYHTLRGIPYKGNRVYTKQEDKLFETIDAFYTVIKDYTSIITIKIDRFEADDVIAAYRNIQRDNGHEVYILSGDKDFIQLIDDHTYIIEPKELKIRNSDPSDKDYIKDINYFLFEKIIRGDRSDNVLASYPFVRKDKIMKAYTDDYHRVNFMNERIIHHDVSNDERRAYLVKDLFEENKMLLDLNCQPPNIKPILYEGVKEAISQVNRYNRFAFVRFLNSNNLVKLKEKIDSYEEMLLINMKNKNT